MAMPETEYTTTPDGVHIAFQASGSGPPDIASVRWAAGLAGPSGD